MSRIEVILRNGEQRTVAGSDGLSLMEHIRNAGIDELLALCGGCCSCATCHVYVDSSFAGCTPTITENEDGLLDGSEYRKGNSRLSCQIPFSDALDGITVTIAPEE